MAFNCIFPTQPQIGQFLSYLIPSQIRIPILENAARKEFSLCLSRNHNPKRMRRAVPRLRQRTVRDAEKDLHRLFRKYFAPRFIFGRLLMEFLDRLERRFDFYF